GEPRAERPASPSSAISRLEPPGSKTTYWRPRALSSARRPEHLLNVLPMVPRVAATRSGPIRRLAAAGYEARAATPRQPAPAAGRARDGRGRRPKRRPGNPRRAEAPRRPARG